MRTTAELQADLAREKADKARLAAEMHDIHSRAEGRALDAGQQERWNNLQRGLEKTDERIETLERDMRTRLADRIDVETVEYGDGAAPHHPGFNVNRRGVGSRWVEPRNWDDHDEVRGRTVDAIAASGADDHSLARIEAVAEANRAAARSMLAASDPHYQRAFLKMVRDPQVGINRMTGEERAALERAMSVGTNADGGFLLPTHLDPSIILTNAGSQNVMRQLARVVTLAQGDTWHGVSSDGVSASWDPELSEVSDDTPVIGDVSISVHQAQAFVPFSVQAGDDIDNLGQELSRLFADAKDRLEGAAFEQGVGTTEPDGVWAAVSAVTASRVVSTTAATIGLADIHAVYRAVPGRFRRNASWLAHPLYTLAIKALGTEVSATYSGDLRDPSAGRILGRPVYESDDAPATQTTTTLDNEVLVGDFSQYTIVDRLGMTAELVPHLFGDSNRPIGARGLYARWRVGGKPVNVDAWRLLVDRTSA